MSNAKASSQEAMEKGLIARLRKLFFESKREFINFMGSCNLEKTRLVKIQRGKSSENNSGIVLWFWCKSKDQLLQVGQKYNELVKEITEWVDHICPLPRVTTAFYNRFPANDIGFAPTAVMADTRQFRKETRKFLFTQYLVVSFL